MNSIQFNVHFNSYNSLRYVNTKTVKDDKKIKRGPIGAQRANCHVGHTEGQKEK